MHHYHMWHLLNTILIGYILWIKLHFHGLLIHEIFSAQNIKTTSLVITCTQTTGPKRYRTPSQHLKLYCEPKRCIAIIITKQHQLKLVSVLFLRASNHLARVGDDKVKSNSAGEERDKRANEEHHFWLYCFIRRLG